MAELSLGEVVIRASSLRPTGAPASGAAISGSARLTFPAFSSATGKAAWGTSVTGAVTVEVEGYPGAFVAEYTLGFAGPQRLQVRRLVALFLACGVALGDRVEGWARGARGAARLRLRVTKAAALAAAATPGTAPATPKSEPRTQARRFEAALSQEGGSGAAAAPPSPHPRALEDAPRGRRLLRAGRPERLDAKLDAAGLREKRARVDAAFEYATSPEGSSGAEGAEGAEGSGASSGGAARRRRSGAARRKPAAKPRGPRAPRPSRAEARARAAAVAAHEEDAAAAAAAAARRALVRAAVDAECEAAAGRGVAGAAEELAAWALCQLGFGGHLLEVSQTQ